MAVTVNLGHTYLLQGDRRSAWLWYEKTVPLIEDESALQDGPLADFVRFIQRAWQPELAREAQDWFTENGQEWLAKNTSAEKRFAQGNHAEALTLYQQNPGGAASGQRYRYTCGSGEL
ncbi:hypothetical protein [Accumulibacter sp.]|uniref:hypothetical protein n=1 Tax=Accumulibacter sp. TaxID=2053492 RepID=UPI00258CEE12|nr:hypothetical protein [Accumulibacter sp.]